MPKDTSGAKAAKNRMASLFRSLAPYMPFNKKSTRRSKNRTKSATRKQSGGSKEAWKKMGERVRLTRNSRLKATAEEFKPEFHALRVPKPRKNSNANFTRKENKKMANELFHKLSQFHAHRGELIHEKN